MAQRDNWDGEYDVVVIGSGAGGLTSALVAHDLGLDTLLIEKSDLVGGTTAVSGGAVWVPDNPQMQALDCPDSLEDGLRYLRETVGEELDEDKARAYIETGRQLVRYLERHSRVQFAAGPFPDYYSARPGGKPQYRALNPLPLAASELGEDAQRIRPPLAPTRVAGVSFTTGELVTMLRKEPGWIRLALGLALGWRAKSRAAPRLAQGNALVGRCLLSLKERGVPLWRGTALRELIADDTGVIGIVAERDDALLRIRARRGVILAAGGFGSNAEMRRRYLARCPDPARSVAPAVNHGDAIAAGMRLGADTALMDEAWWIPVYRLRRSGLTFGMFFERAFPGSIIVDRHGRRFMNEAANYDAAGRAMADAALAEGLDTPGFMIFDARYRSRYIAGPLKPSPPVADRLLRREVREMLFKAPTLDALAAQIGVDAAALRDTVERFNAFARSGRDADFRRGEEPYERFFSDPRVGPNSTMAPLTRAPFYAIAIHPGDIGTRGGLVTDRDGRVIDTRGAAIPGLYAVGSSAASMMGRSYPGGGATIGPAMVFGARAAMHVAGKTLPAED